MPATAPRRRMVLAEIAALLLAVDVVVALALGAPTWVPIAFGVLAVDAAAYALWQLRAVRAADHASPAVRATAAV